VNASDASRGSVPTDRHRVLATALLVGFALLLAADVLSPRRPLAGAGLAALRSGAAMMGLAARALTWAALEALRFAPLGVLAVFATRDRDGRLARLRHVVVPALAASLACGAAALAIAARGRPGTIDFVLPAAGISLGVAAGLAWRRGRRARLAFMAALAGGGAAIAAAGAAVVWLALEPRPSVAAPVPPSSADKVRLVEALRALHPRYIPPGETRTLRLPRADVERLVAWGSSIQGSVRAAVRLEEADLVSVLASVPLPGAGDRWLNVAAALRLRVDRGRIDLAVTAFRFGRWTAPQVLAGPLSATLVEAVAADPRVATLLPAVQSVRLEADAATATIAHVDVPRGLIPGLVWGEDDFGALRAEIGEHVLNLLGALDRAPAGDARFGQALEAAFAFARDRSRGRSPVDENRAALMALGVVLGHERLAAALGERLDEEAEARARRIREGTTVRGRGDWVRHFAVSGALTVLASVSPSDAAGVFKEERDSAGGSGFSFGDLLADRAGTTFASLATRDDRSAAAMQARLVRGFAVEDFFPPAADLPEGIAEGELLERYGGVGGPAYRRVTDEIERRVAACAAYAP
jgi:hypothetical protein